MANNSKYFKGTHRSVYGIMYTVQCMYNQNMDFGDFLLILFSFIKKILNSFFLFIFLLLIDFYSCTLTLTEGEFILKHL